jgi:hypothetical protein
VGAKNQKKKAAFHAAKNCRFAAQILADIPTLILMSDLAGGGDNQIPLLQQ